MEFIFLGTGTSAGLPCIDCITAPLERKMCKMCLSVLTPEGKRNMKRNTSAVVRIHIKEGGKVTIVIDAGKAFQMSALKWFPKYGLREIDAILITHSHADTWTLYRLIRSRINIYLLQKTFWALVSKECASGGGDVLEFKWHIISDQTPFEVNDTGIHITPFSDHLHSSRSFTLPDEVPSQVLECKAFLSFRFKISTACLHLRHITHPQGILERGHIPMIRATRTYLTGFCHAATYKEYVSMGEIVGGVLEDQREMAALDAKGFSVEKGDVIWIRPSHDGLRVMVDDGVVWDET
ncbi:hypothetical protein EDD18DRAFT_1309519 [Armillaria luteobubalina]|uniref:Metallo-beta-lactamase domain-containing protein n=1 Tax=Armillaria luteobubalina TaxID=153913 RepID=A0AA39Q5C2_9AGAR|nr:hypothetical protein EDD18DRAFT_1309519 [Armillaria luteobubalina]